MFVFFRFFSLKTVPSSLRINTYLNVFVPCCVFITSFSKEFTFFNERHLYNHIYTMNGPYESRPFHVNSPLTENETA